MTTIAKSPHNHPFYTVLEVEWSTYDDVRARLERQGNLWKHQTKDKDGFELIVFGSTALKKEQTQF